MHFELNKYHCTLIFPNVLRSHLLSGLPLSAIWFRRFFHILLLLCSPIIFGCYNSLLHYRAHNQRFHPWRRQQRRRRWWWLQNWKLLCCKARATFLLSRSWNFIIPLLSLVVVVVLVLFSSLSSFHFISLLLLISISGFIHQLFFSFSHFAGIYTRLAQTHSVWLQFVIVIG